MNLTPGRLQTPEASEPSLNLPPRLHPGTSKTSLEPCASRAPGHPEPPGLLEPCQTTRNLRKHPGISFVTLDSAPKHPATPETCLNLTPACPETSGTFLEPYTWPAPDHPETSGTLLEPDSERPQATPKHFLG